MKSKAKPVSLPVIDLFAGPGGLGEGFEQYSDKNYSFNIVLSIEKNKYAYQTLKLRSFFRFFHHAGLNIPHDYYRYLNEEITYNELFSTYPDAAAAAEIRTWQCELGGENYPHEMIDTRIRNALNGHTAWILVGGPPCQAYSLVGRSRMKNASDYKQAASFDDDDRHVLYRQYLRIIALHSPPIFVMENVKGMLSAKITGTPVFPMIMKDLSRPATAARNYFNGRNYSNARYRLFSFVTGTQPDGPEEYLIRAENYGIPQKRHRVILLGLREDIFPASWVIQPCLEKSYNDPSVRSIISSLPALRSGVSDKPDTLENWRSAIQKIKSKNWFKELPQDIRDEMSLALTRIALDKLPRGDKSGLRFPSGKLNQWYSDPSLYCVCNHETRTHMTSDLWRYLFVSAFGSVRHRSPTLKDFPSDLLPAHRNAKKDQDNFVFNDRFRVQLDHKPATTVTSHISKDGHYFIHYDPGQCRSLTVREAARLQTFPDNYFFVGPRTEQYRQVGNAVPPLLAQQIAAIVSEIFGQ